MNTTRVIGVGIVLVLFMYLGYIYVRNHYNIPNGVLPILTIFVLVAAYVIVKCVKRLRRRKHKVREFFSEDTKAQVLSKQNHRCAKCNRLLNVVDYDHKDDDRSNNTESNCQALCPNCHAVKTRR
jgi:hypothetical protein